MLDFAMATASSLLATAQQDGLELAGGVMSSQVTLYTSVQGSATLQL